METLFASQNGVSMLIKRNVKSVTLTIDNTVTRCTKWWHLRDAVITHLRSLGMTLEDAACDADIVLHTSRTIAIGQMWAF